MSTLTYQQALSQLDKSAPDARCWMVASDSPLLGEELATRLIAKAVSGPLDFNLTRLEGSSQLLASAVMAAAEEFPMGSQRRVVWVRGAQDVPDAQLLRLASYTAEVPDTTVLLITSAGGAASARDEVADDSSKGGMRKLADAVRASGVYVKASLQPADLEDWLRREMETAGLTATAPLRRLILNRVGTDLAALRSEVAKLKCYMGGRAKVEEGDVTAIVTQTPASRVYHLSDALLSHDAARALTVLDDLLATDEPELRIVGYLTTYFRGLIKMHALMERGESDERISSLIKKDKWKVEKERRLLRKFSGKDLQDAIELLLRADLGIKSGKEPRLLLELLILRLCRPPAAAKPSVEARNPVGRNST